MYSGEVSDAGAEYVVEVAFVTGLVYDDVADTDEAWYAGSELVEAWVAAAGTWL